ncbi:MAG: MFS transporter [Conexivisphaera sp.]|jgi:MFS family permease
MTASAYQPRTGANWRAVIGGMIGWALDAYDLTLILFIARLLADEFFPRTSVVAGLMALFASYALTLLARPLGGFIFGYLADRWGRRPVMFVSLLGLGISSALTGVLPTYAQIGLTATFLFVLLRLVVGIFVGGEPGGSHTIAIESSSPGLRGLVSGVLQSGYMWGYALGALTFLGLTSIYPHAAFVSYAWRYAFFISLVVAFLGIAVRYAVPESAIFRDIKERGETSRMPLAEFFRRHARDWAPVWVIMAGAYWVAYASMGFLPTLLETFLKVPASSTLSIMLYGAIVEGIFMWIGGHLSTYTTRRGMFMIAGVIGVLTSYFLVRAIVTTSYGYMVLGAGGLMALAGLGGGVMLAHIAELFPTRVRGSAVGSLWNLANVGSVIPLIMGAPVIAIYGPLDGFTLIMVIGFVIEIIGALASRDRTRALME